MRSQIVLSLSHYVYLNKEERYAIHKGQKIETVGVSVPVWFHKGNTSEPGVEVFCKYFIDNDKNQESIIYSVSQGYQFNLPQLPKNFAKPKLSLDAWRAMTEEQRDHWYQKNKTPTNSEFLLDLKDGGSASMRWFQHNKKITGKKVIVIKNYVEIKDISVLEESFL